MTQDNCHRFREQQLFDEVGILRIIDDDSLFDFICFIII